MANFNMYFSCCLALITLPWRTTTGLPVRTSDAERCAQCTVHFKALLLNIRNLSNSDVLCYGISADKVVMKTQSDTALACAPTLNQTSRCMMQRNTSFSESECFQNIKKDVAYYDAAIQSYLSLRDRRSQDEIPLLRATLSIIQSLRKNCPLMPQGDTHSSEDVASLWGSDTFTNRQKMCMMMRGFHIRTITINRAMGYIGSGEHRK